MKAEHAKKNWSLRLESRRLHRRLGTVFALFFIFSAVTGVILNHASDLNLDRYHIPVSLASGYFEEIETQQFPGFSLGEKWMYSLGGALWLGERKVAVCDSGLRSGVMVEEQIFALCGDYLLVISVEGALIEEMVGFGSLERLGSWDHRLVAEQGNRALQLDLLTLELTELNHSSTSNSSVPISSKHFEDRISWAVAENLDQQTIDFHLPSVSWEKWILDIHSGTYFGGLGVLFLDALAVVLIVSAVTGLVMSLSNSSGSTVSNTSPGTKSVDQK